MCRGGGVSFVDNGLFKVANQFDFIGALFFRTKASSFNVSENTGQFKIIKKTFTQQFSQIYFARLQALRPVILKKMTTLNG